MPEARQKVDEIFLLLIINLIITDSLSNVKNDELFRYVSD